MANQQEHPDTRQVGGSHYKAPYQHWDLVADAGLGYFEGQITKYITRWQKKNGVEDVEKAIHYFEKLVSLYKEGRIGRQHHPATIVSEAFDKFQEANKLYKEEHDIFIRVLFYHNMPELMNIHPWLQKLLKKAQDLRSNTISKDVR